MILQRLWPLRLSCWPRSLACACARTASWGVAYPPADRAAPRPADRLPARHVGEPRGLVRTFERAATPFGFLVCPRGNAPLGDGGSGYKMWTGDYASVAPTIHAALDAADALAPGKRSGQGGTLIGYSNGAYFAAEVACSEPGRWTGLVLLSMHLELDATRLARAGVTRVVLAAGDRDEARASMQSLAARLNQDRGTAPLEARYMSLGDVGHSFPSDMGARMCAAIAWVRGTMCTLSL